MPLSCLCMHTEVQKTLQLLSLTLKSAKQATVSWEKMLPLTVSVPRKLSFSSKPLSMCLNCLCFMGNPIPKGIPSSSPRFPSLGKSILWVQISTAALGRHRL